MVTVYVCLVLIVICILGIVAIYKYSQTPAAKEQAQKERMEREKWSEELREWKQRISEVVDEKERAFLQENNLETVVKFSYNSYSCFGKCNRNNQFLFTGITAVDEK